MDIVGDRSYVELPGDKQHELPPLLVHLAPRVKRLDKVVEMAKDLIENEVLAPNVFAEPELDHERRRMDLAIQMVEQYLSMVMHWQWGDGVIEWIRQCETTFESRSDLRPFLRPDVWPHAGRTSFVNLLSDKSVPTDGVELHKAVGLRLAFRQPPPMKCCSDQFLFYLNGSVASTAYDKWAQMSPDPVSSLPPERFHFQVVTM
jgi:hypothetical protein